MRQDPTVWMWDIRAASRGGAARTASLSRVCAFWSWEGGASFLLVKTCILDQKCAPPLMIESHCPGIYIYNGNVRNFSELRRADF